MKKSLLLAFVFVCSCAESARPTVTEADVWIDELGAHARGLPATECALVERVSVPRVDSLRAVVSPELGFYISSSVEQGGALRVQINLVEAVPAGELDVLLFVNEEPAQPSSAAVACVVGSSP